MLNDIHLYTEALAFLVALACAKKLRLGALIWFLPYLAYIVAVELTSRHLRTIGSGYSMSWAYNLMNLLNQCFYSYIFYRYAANETHRRIIIIILSLFLIYSAFYYTATSFLVFGSQPVAVGGILQIIFPCLFIYQYMRNDEQAVQAHYTSGVWISAGLLIFYVSTSQVFSLLEYIRTYQLTLGGEPLYRIVPRYLSAILYSCISIALIVWKKPVTNSQ